jgi:MGT family glycosyltransferase
VLSLGGADPADLPPLPGDPLVVRYAPQPELIARATLAITHAGMNTVMEALAFGTPLVAIPITNDQPGVAARLRQVGAGEVLRLRQLNVRRLRAAVERVLTEPCYRAAAGRMQEAIRAAGGVTRAAEIVETAIATRVPVLAQCSELPRGAQRRLDRP